MVWECNRWPHIVHLENQLANVDLVMAIGGSDIIAICWEREEGEAVGSQPGRVGVAEGLDVWLSNIQHSVMEQTRP